VNLAIRQGRGSGLFRMLALERAAVVARRGRFRFGGRWRSCRRHNCCSRWQASTRYYSLVDGPAKQRDDQDHSRRSSAEHCSCNSERWRPILL
jgi:hypothetical protein